MKLFKFALCVPLIILFAGMSIVDEPLKQVLTMYFCTYIATLAVIRLVIFPLIAFIILSTIKQANRILDYAISGYAVFN